MVNDIEFSGTEFSGTEEFMKFVKDPSFQATGSASSLDVKPASDIQGEHVQSIGETYTENMQSAKFDPVYEKLHVYVPTLPTPQKSLTYPIFSLFKHHLKEPLEIVVESDDVGNFIVWNEDFGLSGMGNTKEEALEEFEDLIFADYNSLKSIQKETLSEGAKELLSKYKRYLG